MNEIEDRTYTCCSRHTKFDWKLLKESCNGKFFKLEFEVPSDATEESKGEKRINHSLWQPIADHNERPNRIQ